MRNIVMYNACHHPYTSVSYRQAATLYVVSTVKGHPNTIAVVISQEAPLAQTDHTSHYDS